MGTRPETDSEIEIEATHEMIEAGADIIWRQARDVNDGWVNPADVARAVWVAMRALSRKRALRSF